MNRPIGLLAAGVAAILCVLPGCGRGTARADELSQLRANQALLQQRLDELAKGPPATAGAYPSAAPTKAAGGGSFPRSFRVPGTDTSVRIGGTISMEAGSRW